MMSFSNVAMGFSEFYIVGHCPINFLWQSAVVTITVSMGIVFNGMATTTAFTKNGDRNGLH